LLLQQFVIDVAVKELLRPLLICQSRCSCLCRKKYGD